MRNINLLRGQVVVPFKSYCYIYFVIYDGISDKAQECVLDWIIDALIRLYVL